MNNLKELKNRIELSREKLNWGLANGKTFNELYLESIELDQLIEEYLEQASN